MQDQTSIAALLRDNRAIPVVTFTTVAEAVPVGRALLAGGVSVIEVTLRTTAGLDALHALARDCPGLVLGAGTVLSKRQAEAAAKAGARFLVSPGHTEALITVAREIGLPWMLGASTLSEVMRLRDSGFLVQKFFPAEPMGGVATLKAIGSVVPDVKFCPTGGITAETARSYLALPNVVAVGGSWFVPMSGADLDLVKASARDAVETLNPH